MVRASSQTQTMVRVNCQNGDGGGSGIGELLEGANLHFGGCQLSWGCFIEKGGNPKRLVLWVPVSFPLHECVDLVGCALDGQAIHLLSKLQDVPLVLAKATCLRDKMLAAWCCGHINVGNQSIYLHRSGPLLENGLDSPKNRYGLSGFKKALLQNP